MSAASLGNLLVESHCRVVLLREGTLQVRMSMTDIGTGSYTILSQIAAEMIGLPLERIRMELVDSEFPRSSGSGGSFGAASAGSAMYVACEKPRSALAKAATIDPLAAEFKDGCVVGGGKSVSLDQLVGANGLAADGMIEPGVT